ncbi:MAG: hypothetical protein Q9217_004055 [Psora testacea]
MPREEVFLISPFVLNVRQAGTNIMHMLKHARDLVQHRHQRRGRKRIYATRIRLLKWLYTGGDEDGALPAIGRKENRKAISDDHLDDDTNTDSMNSKETLFSAQRDDDLENAGPAETIKMKPKNKHDIEPTGTTNTMLQRPQKASVTLRLRGKAADTLEWI